MNWKDHFIFKPLTSDEIKPGMIAKLIIGNEKLWSESGWIKDRKGETFKVVRLYNDNKKGVVVMAPARNGELGECVGDIDWFLFREA